MTERSAALAATAALMVVVHLHAQQPDDSLSKLQALGLPEIEGSVPVIYVSSQKERAIRLQKSLEAAHSWFEKQLHVVVPIELAVLDAETWPKISPLPYGMMYANTQGKRGLIVFPAVTTKSKGQWLAEIDSGQRQAEPGADREHAPGGVLENEPVLYHEDGHIITASMHIRSYNPFVYELLASVFMAGYIGAERPDLNWVFENARSRPWRNQTALPRYTTLADLDYIYTGVGADNYYWFQYQFKRLADFLANGQSFSSVVEKMQTAFPAAKAKQETLDEIAAHLESIRPGFKKMAGQLVGPSTITRIMPSACQEPKTLGDQCRPDAPSCTPIAVQNDTAGPLVLTTVPSGKKFDVPPHSWRSYLFAVGTSLKLPAGTCLVTRDEPTLATIGKQ